MWGLPKGRKQLAANIDAASAEVDTNAGEENEEIKPIGKGIFGNNYDQFKGKVKAAFDSLMESKGVFKCLIPLLLPLLRLPPCTTSKRFLPLFCTFPRVDECK